MLTDAETDILKRALGLLWRRTPYRNRVAAHVDGPTIGALRDLEARGLLFHDRAAGYGKMRVFRVTIPGVEAIGRKSLKATLLPSAFLPPPVQESMPLAA